MANARWAVVLGGLVIVAACGPVEGPAPPDTGEAKQASGAASATDQRWWGVANLNRVNYYIHPSVSDTPDGDACGTVCASCSKCTVPHATGIRKSMEAIERLTAIDFEEKTWPPGNDTEPYILFVDHDSESNHQYTRSDLKWYKDQGSSPEVELWSLYKDLLRTASGSPGDPGYRHEDHLIKFDQNVAWWTPPALKSPGLPNDDLSRGTPLHETGHALNLIHEQSRSDAPDYLRTFECCSSDPTMITPFDPADDLHLSKYDFHSIMQYSSYTGCNTDDNGDCRCMPIIAKDPLFPGQPLIDNVLQGPACEGLSPNTFGYEIANIAPYDKGPDAVMPGVLSHEDINALHLMYPPSLGERTSLNQLGTALAVGDFDGDGYDDLAVGVPGDDVNGNQSGSVVVYKGTHRGLAPWRRRHPDNADEGAHYGSALAAADLDGDGKDELIVGAPGEVVSNVAVGAVHVLAGSDEGPSTSTRITMTNAGFPAVPAAGDAFGNALAVGDFDGNGAKEIAVGAKGKSRVFVVNAAYQKYTTLGTLRVPADTFGYALAAGDIDGDGVDDLAIGSPEMGYSNKAGKVYVALGQSAGGMAAPYAVAEPVSTPAAHDHFGYAVDIGKLELPEEKRYLVAGAPDREDGRVFVMEGPVPGAGAVHTRKLSTQTPGAMFGAAVAVGKLHGVRTVVIGAPEGKGRLGEVFFSESSPSGLQSTASVWEPWSHGDPEPYDLFGVALAIGNFDGDGSNDVAIAATGKDTLAGAVWVVRGHDEAPQLEWAEQDKFTTYLVEGNPELYRH